MALARQKLAQLLQWLTWLLMLGMLVSAIFYWPQRLTNHRLWLGSLTIGAVVLLVIGIYFWRQLTSRQQRIISWCLFAVGLIWQIILIIALSTSNDWDPQKVLMSLTQRTMYKNNYVLYNYLSYCSNNLLLFYCYAGLLVLSQLLHLSLTWTLINCFNAVVIDLAVVLFYLTLKKITAKKVAHTAFLVLTITLVFSPWVIITYTDTLSLLTTALALYSLVNIKLAQAQIKRYGWSAVAGITIALGWYMKASSIIFALALILVLLVFKTPWKKISSWLLLTSLVGFGLTFVTISTINQHQQLYPINSELKHPATYYMMLGSKGHGAWNVTDFNRIVATKGEKNKTQLGWQTYQQRVLKMGWRYPLFLMKKFYYTVRDGSFGWGENSTPRGFLIQNRPQTTTLGGFLRSLFYPLGHYVSIYYVLAQVWWIAILVGAVITLWQQRRQQPHFLQVCLYLTIIGGLMYLMLFESGMSRYLIQFLPFYVFIGVLGQHDPNK